MEKLAGCEQPGESAREIARVGFLRRTPLNTKLRVKARPLVVPQTAKITTGL
jgi:hypothetical protein